VLVISTESLEDPRHLVVIAGTKRRSPEVARRAELEQHSGSALVVGSFDYDHDVVGADGPVDLLETSSMFLGECVGLIASVHGLAGIPDPLLGPVH
jgi:hypothetical protein